MMEQPLIFETSKNGRKAYSLPDLSQQMTDIKDIIPEKYLRKKPAGLPEVSEIDTVRHFTKLSQRNHGVDSGFYPLGSCTMKYNPKVNEDIANLPGFLHVHPYQPEETVQGALKLMYDMQNFLAEIAGMDSVTLQPAAGSHGELTGLMIIKSYLKSIGEHQRTKVLIPDAAHGTNPASATMCGFTVQEIKSNSDGGVDIDALKESVDNTVAALMLTNPNTIGLFDENILEVTKTVHNAGGLLYYDGANANAILGITRPGDMGFDVVHFNLHKTFATPHGGGGPGAGPVGVKKFLAPFLPIPRVIKQDENYKLDYDYPDSIGRVRSFYGNFGVIVKAYSYIISLGAKGLKEVSEIAVLNANYLKEKLKQYYELPYDRRCMHEFVISGKRQTKSGVHTLDIAKRLLDFGIHPPTIYFPLIVEEAMMIEPTETESKETLDMFADLLKAIALEAEKTPQVVKDAPHNTPVKRLDEVGAARKPLLKWDRFL
jgi:glycine dehydrogenase subunit 2